MNSTSSTDLGKSGKRLFMLYYGDYERCSSGPYIGDANLDFAELASSFRRDCYAQAQAKAEDFCAVYESQFASWLVAQGFLETVETTDVEISISSSGEDAYIPNHWPVCPQCDDGRGEPHYGEVRKSLNRIKFFRRCTACCYEWGYTEEANDTSRPMLDDDGRDTTGGCVPFAIIKACGLKFATVLEVCICNGWTESEGMHQTDAIFAARKLGFNLCWQAVHGVGTTSAPTLRQLLVLLPGGQNYIVGVKGHWLAIVDGTVVDNDANSGLGKKVLEVYVVQPVRGTTS